MLILGIDTSAKSASVALLEDSEVLSEFNVNLRPQHSRRILPMISEAMKSAERDIGDVGLFCVSRGPGSFTGLRIGVSTVKGLAFAKSTPCAGVSTLEALAENLVTLPAGSVICPVMDARRDEFYNALFRVTATGISRLCCDRAISLGALAEELSALDSPITVNGDGARKLMSLMDGLSGFDFSVTLATGRLLYQSGVSVATVGLRMLSRGETCAPDKLTPDYIRVSQAQRLSGEE